MDFVVHGDDVSTDADGLDTYRLVKAAGMYKECKRTPGVSTTDAVSRILFGPSASSSALSSPSRDNLDMDLLQAFAKDPGRVEPYIRTSQMFLDDVEITAETSIPSPTKNAVLALVGPIPAGIKKVVYVEGPFDLFSADDVDFLERTAASGAPVVVGVWGPGDVRRSTGAPSVLSFQERALGVLQCKVGPLRELLPLHDADIGPTPVRPRRHPPRQAVRRGRIPPPLPGQGRTRPEALILAPGH